VEDLVNVFCDLFAVFRLFFFSLMYLSLLLLLGLASLLQIRGISGMRVSLANLLSNFRMSIFLKFWMMALFFVALLVGEMIALEGNRYFSVMSHKNQQNMRGVAKNFTHV
jgi:hypothetical protein